MRHTVRKVSFVILHCALAMSVASSSAAQSCLGIDACLLSPTRSDAGRPIGVNGCSVPPEAGALGQFWGTVFESACNQHDRDWGSFRPDIASWFTQSNAAFLDNMLAICQAQAAVVPTQCAQIANLFFFAVSTTSIAADIYRRSQYFASDCACRTLPGAPANLTAQVFPGLTGAQVSLQWTPGNEATSYQVEVLQPALAPLDTVSPLPAFMAAGVPTGVYRVQVRAVNPLGTSGPSNVIDLVVGSGVPCVPPAAPLQPTATLISGSATVTWQPVAGATSYVVQAGSLSGGSDLFNGNVGNTTTIGATGLPPGFRAFVRVFAVNACGISAPAPEVVVGS
jgi:hypothetical protein